MPSRLHSLSFVSVFLLAALASLPACTVEQDPTPPVAGTLGTEPPAARGPLASPFLRPCEVFDETSATLIEPSARGEKDETRFQTFAICLRNADSTKPAPMARFDRMTTETFRTRVCAGRDHPIEMIEGLGEAACVWKPASGVGEVQVAAVKNGTSVLLGPGSLEGCRASMERVLLRLDFVESPKAPSSP